MPHFAHPYHSDNLSQRRRASPWRQQPLLLNCTLQWWGVVTLLLPGLVRSEPHLHGRSYLSVEEYTTVECFVKGDCERRKWNLGHSTTSWRGWFRFVLVMLPVFGYRPLWTPEVKVERPIIFQNNFLLKTPNHKTHQHYICISLHVSCCVKNLKGIKLEHKEMEIN